MPQNHKSTKSHEKRFTPIPSELEDKIICEIKAIDIVNPIWEAQVRNHLKITDLRLGYLINFNVVNIGQGIKRFVK